MLKKLYLLTFAGEGVALAKQLAKDGVEVIVGQVKDNKDILTKDETYKPEDEQEKKKRLALGSDVRKTDAAELVKRALAEKEKKDCFFFTDFNTLFRYSQKVAGSGMPGIYPTSEDRSLEVDRKKAKEFVEKNYPDIKVAEVEELKTVDEGKKFLDETDSSWVLKGYDMDAPSFVPSSYDPEVNANEVKAQLEKYKAAYEKSGYELERKIDDPVELTPQAVFKDGIFLGSICCIENKRFGEGETGAMSGCAGDLVFQIFPEDRLFKMAFPKIVFEMARRHKGVFYWDASILFDKKGTPFFGEFCANRPGYNCLFSEMAMVGSPKRYIQELMDGNDPYSNSLFRFGASVRLFNCPDGFDGEKAPKKAPAGREVNGELWEMDINNGKTNGYTWEMGVTVAGANDPRNAIKKALIQAKMVEMVPKPSFRSDLMASDYPQAIVKRFAWGKRQGLY